VQGAEAAGEIIAALRRLHAWGDVDVIIIARGGGSLEDLAPFNDETLAREIRRSTIPVVSAVGHETDYTICDFVADLRAPTPSAAAELVVPRKIELQETLHDLYRRLLASQNRCLALQRERLHSLAARFKDPRRYLADYAIQVDDLRERLKRALAHRTEAVAGRLKPLEARLRGADPRRRIREHSLLLAGLEKNLRGGWNRFLLERSERLKKNAALLSSLSPLAVLQRGYSITRRLPEGEIVRDAKLLTPGNRLDIQVALGRIEARVEKIK